MCGIVGVAFVPEPRQAKVADAIGRALAAMRRRGPDGYTLFIEDGCLLGQTFLLITDPEGGGVPFLSHDGRFAVVMNGQLYNHHQLRRDPRLQAGLFATGSDCQLVASGVAAYGLDFLARLRGMFGIAIYDRRERTLTLARDRVGIRPLYYCATAGHVSFGSEPQGLVEHGLAPSTPDAQSCFECMVLRQPLEPSTMWADVKAVLPGQTVTFHQTPDGIDVHRSRYAPDAFASASTRTDELVLADELEGDARLAELLDEAVRLRLPEHVRFSLFLSGGLDSTIVASLLPKDHPHRLPCLAAGFDAEPMLDERVEARKAANHLGLELQETTLTPDAFLAIWPWMLRVSGAPLMFNSGMPLYWMSRVARQQGAKVMLSGEGADELFCGYQRYARYAQRQDDGSPEFLLDDDEDILPWREVQDEWLPAGADGDMAWDRLRQRLADAFSPAATTYRGLRRKLHFDRHNYLRNLLMRIDRVGLATSIETRVPFLDTEFVGALLTRDPAGNLHPLRQGAPANKLFLRRAFEDRLGLLASAPKTAFPLPVAAWAQGRAFQQLASWLGQQLDASGWCRPGLLQRAAEQLGGSGSGSDLAWRRYWTLLNLGAWTLSQHHDSWLDAWKDQLDPTSRDLFATLGREIEGPPLASLQTTIRDHATSGRAVALISSGWLPPRVAPVQGERALLTPA